MLVIEDVSSSSVPAGEFELSVTLTDGKESVVQAVTLIIYPAPEYENDEEEEPIEEVDIEVTESEEIEPIEEEVIEEEEEEVQPKTKEAIEQEIIDEKVFDWREAFAEKERQMFEAGQIDQFTPPEARLKYIEQTGEVEISFD